MAPWPPQDLAAEHGGGGGGCQHLSGGASEKEQSFLFLSAIKSIRELGMQQWASGTLLPRPLRLRPGRHYNSGRWVDRCGEGGLGLGHSCWCSCHTFSNKRELGSPSASASWGGGEWCQGSPEESQKAGETSPLTLPSYPSTP